jgi:hypothetical protein
MSASKLYPNVWKGEERSGGKLNKNSGAKSANAPDLKGPLYIKGVGWFWLSAWSKRGKFGDFYTTDARGMTDEEAEKYCKPKPDGSRQAGQTSHRPIPPGAQNGADSADGDIPF